MNLNAGLLLAKISILDSLRMKGVVKSTTFHLDKTMDWLALAQDRSGAGGVSEGFHLVHGWLPAYPETTGYIIETFFDYAKLTHQKQFFEKALQMADWLRSVQHEDGAIPNSYLTQKMVFDTGQVLFGFVRSHLETGDTSYLQAGIKAGNWLVNTQDDDGAWRKHAVDGIAHTYYSRVAWSLLELHRISSGEIYKQAAEKNFEWTLGNQRENGWFDNASFNRKNHQAPFTHTIAYTLRGIWEAGIYLGKEEYLQKVLKALDNIRGAIHHNGFLPGTLTSAWEGPSSFSCLTGNAQLSILYFKAYQKTGKQNYLSAAKLLLQFLKQKQENRSSDASVSGALAGSFPIWGRYIHFNYPNWAAKFLADALMLELKNGDGEVG